MSKAQFHPLGIVVSSPDGDVILNADNSTMTIFPVGNMLTFSAKIPPNIVINNLTPWQPPKLSDAKAPNGSVYYSTDANKLVFKNYSGGINPLY